MGHITSRFFKPDLKGSKVEGSDKTYTTKETTEVQDVRSPTNHIARTPILVEKLNLEADLRNYRSEPLRMKLMKSLKLDPRSPTVGIYRTPILVEDSLSNKVKSDNFDSPVSIYSCNINDSLMQDVTTPIEPSVNVSGFELGKEISQLETLEPEDIIKEERRNKNLKIVDRPNTFEARRLLDEIISCEEENSLKKIKTIHKKEKKSELKLSEKKNTSEITGKTRAPLSNITSTTNSPLQLHPGGKSCTRNKVMAEYGSENSASPTVKRLAQWDQNNTVII